MSPKDEIFHVRNMGAVEKYLKDYGISHIHRETIATHLNAKLISVQ